MKFTIILAVIVIGVLSAVSRCAHATQTSEWQVSLTRGATGTLVKVHKASTREAAESACAAAVPLSASAITYTCGAARRVFVVTPDPITSKLLSWAPPTQNVDGTVLNNLSGYRIHYGRSASELVNSVQVAVPGATNYRVTNLTTGTWFFAVRAYNSLGGESDLSNIVSVTIQ